MSSETWIHGKGRLGEGGNPLATPAAGGPTLGDMLARGGSQEISYNRVCWRCGALPFRASPCTEKRGEGPPWKHHFLDRDVDHPWTDWPLGELERLAYYLGGKATSSLSTATSFRALASHALELGHSKVERAHYSFAAALYAEKAAKRIRLFEWVLDEWERRLSEEANHAADRSDPG